jgi:ATP-dependent DNA helicase RecG
MNTFNTVALLSRLLQEPNESEWIEFKVNNVDPERIGQNISAIANGAMLSDRDRGFIIYGVEDKTRKKVGTKLRLKELTIGGGVNFENWISNLIEPRLTIELLDLEEDGLNFSILCVEATYDRPVKFKGTEYIRIGENTKKLSEFPNKERALWLATGRRKFEHAIALTNQAPQDVERLLDIDTFYKLTNSARPASQTEVFRKFVTTGLLVDNLQGTFDVTNLAAILFAKDATTFPSIAHKTVRLIKYTGDDKQNSEYEHEGRRGYAVGFSGLIKSILDRIPKQEQYNDGVRKLVYLYPEVAIREIVANALIHQDFTVSGASPVIEIYANRIEVSNPGNSLIEIDRILDERRSRNEKLASLMRDLGLCEERGGGLDKAVIALELRKLPAPDFIPSKDSFRAIMFGPKPFNKMSKLEKRRACFFHCIIRFIQQDYMSNTTLRERFSLEDKDYQFASAVISDTIKAGRIVPADPNQGNKNAKYIPYWSAQAR